jgi:sugar phosphate isomerase/epimerase
MGHLDNIGVCLDLGHAHIGPGIDEAISVFGDRIVSVHVHDNHGTRDEHLWPGEGTIEWPSTIAALKALAHPPAAVLEIAHAPSDTGATIPGRMEQAYGRFA